MTPYLKYYHIRDVEDSRQVEATERRRQEQGRGMMAGWGVHTWVRTPDSSLAAAFIESERSVRDITGWKVAQP
jgi:hypothetical protein